MTALKLPLDGAYCTQVEEHDGIRAGDRITFLTVLHDPRREVRITGTVRAVYVEKHPNTVNRWPDGLVFAEVVLDDDTKTRCWFRRDKPTLAREVDGVLGAAPEGAMF